MTVGDPIRYTISVTAAADIEVEIPLLGEQLGDFTVLDFGQLPPRTENGRGGDGALVSAGRRLRPASTCCPARRSAIDITGQRERIDGNDVSITVISLLAEAGQNPELRDIKPPGSPAL